MVGHDKRDEHDDPGYTGPAALVIDGVVLDVLVDLQGGFQPIDGRYHWYGRVAADPELDRLVGNNQGNNQAHVVLRTPDGERAARLFDPDVWGRFRIAGEGRPPFASGLEDPGLT